MNEFDSKQVIVNNHLVTYYSFLANNPTCTVIFIHGWLSNSKVWFHLMHALKKMNISAYALDLPGFGESQVPTSSVDNNFYVKVVEEFINKLSLKNVILVGHSNGGAIAVKLLNSNNIADKLVLIDAAGIRSKSLEKTIKTTIAKIVKPVFKLSILKPLRSKIYSVMGYEDYINSSYLNKTYQNVINDDISELYKNITIPTLVIWGKEDKSTPLSFGEFIHKNIINSELKIIDGGHFPFIDKPDQVINYLITFIK